MPPTVVGFGSTQLNSGHVSTTPTFSVGSVSVGDEVEFQAWCTSSGNLAAPSSVTDSLGNTLNIQQSCTDATFGKYDLYSCVVANAGTMVLTVTVPGINETASVVGRIVQTLGYTLTFDQSDQDNATDFGNFNDARAPSLTPPSAAVITGYFGGGGYNALNVPTPDATWTVQGGATGGFNQGSALVYNFIGAVATVPHVLYTGFAYGQGVSTTVLYATSGGSTIPSDDEGGPTTRVSLTLAAPWLRGSDEDLPPQSVVTIVDDDGILRLLSPRIAPPLPLSPTEESWFASAADDTAVTTPAPAPTIYPIGPPTSPASDETWLASSVEDDGFVAPAPARVVYPFAPGTSPGSDESWLASAIEDDGVRWPSPALVVFPFAAPTSPSSDDSWMPSAVEDDGFLAPAPALRIYPFAPAVSPGSDEQWLGSAVEDDSFRWPTPAATVYPFAASTSPAADDTWIANAIEDDGFIAPRPSPITYPLGPATSPSADDTWLASAVEDDAFRWPAPAVVVYSYDPGVSPASDDGSFVRQVEDDDARWPLPAPVLYPLPPGTSPASDDTWLAAAVEDVAFRWPAPAPQTYAFAPPSSPGDDEFIFTAPFGIDDDPSCLSMPWPVVWYPLHWSVDDELAFGVPPANAIRVYATVGTDRLVDAGIGTEVLVDVATGTVLLVRSRAGTQ